MSLKLNASPRSSRMLIQKLKLKIPTCKFLERRSRQEGSKRSFLMRNQLLLRGRMSMKPRKVVRRFVR